jgi:hypothetical protein
MTVVNVNERCESTVDKLESVRQYLMKLYQNAGLLRLYSCIANLGVTSSQMLGSYGPSADGKPYERPSFHTEESPSGLLARSGSYNVRSKFVDDDGQVYAGASLGSCGLMAFLLSQRFFFWGLSSAGDDGIL